MSPSRVNMDRVSTFACALLASSSLYACGDDDLSTPGDDAGTRNGRGSGGKGSGSGDSDADAGGSPGDTSPVYALTTQILGTEAVDNTSYVLVTNSLERGTQLSLGDGMVEIPGRALGAGPENGGALYVVSDQAPTLTRYDLTDDGELEEGKSVSFLNQGVSAFSEYGAQFQFVAEDKAYWFDGRTAQIVVWDPEAMQVKTSISLTDLAFEREVLTFTAAPVRAGDAIYSFVGWREGPEVPSRAAVVVIDTSNDTAEVVMSETCGYVRDGYLAPDGMLYLATEAYGAAVNYLNSESAAEPCLLRFDTDEGAFDEDFDVELESLFDGDSAGSLIAGPDGSAFLRVLDVSAVPDDTNHPRVLASVAAWGWAKLTVGDDPTAMVIEDAALSGGSVLPLVLGDRWFSPVFVGGASTEFIELTADGPVSNGTIEVPGLVFSAVKLR